MFLQQPTIALNSPARLFSNLQCQACEKLDQFLRRCRTCSEWRT